MSYATVNSLSDDDWTSAGVFLAVARAGSMVAAAKALGLSQPSVTRVIQELEEKRDGNVGPGKHCDAACRVRIAFDQFADVHDRDVPLSPQKRLGKASADPTWPPYQATCDTFLFTILQ